MMVFVAVFSVFAIVMIAMAVGVMLGRKPIQGSCGGLNNVGAERACGCVDVCKNDPDKKPLNKTQTAMPAEPAIYTPGNKR